MKKRINKIDIIKPRICFWITNDTWKTLSLKEKDYIIMLYSKKYKYRTIMRKLHIVDYSSYYRIQERVKHKLARDVAKYNENYKKSLLKQ